MCQQEVVGVGAVMADEPEQGRAVRPPVMRPRRVAAASSSCEVLAAGTRVMLRLMCGKMCGEALCSVLSRSKIQVSIALESRHAQTRPQSAPVALLHARPPGRTPTRRASAASTTRRRTRSCPTCACSRAGSTACACCSAIRSKSPAAIARPDLNAAVGGAPNSQHAQGLAVDFTCPGFGPPARGCARRPGLRASSSTSASTSSRDWMHLSFSAAPRRRVLTIYDTREGYLDGLVDEHRQVV